jgi:hypothetical protein
MDGVTYDLSPLAGQDFAFQDPVKKYEYTLVLLQIAAVVAASHHDITQCGFVFFQAICGPAKKPCGPAKQPKHGMTA